jgi:hypothetical protein
MSHPTAHACDISAVAPTTPQPRAAVVRRFALVLMLLGILGALAVMAHWSVEGAAPPATLSVIGETFDKGF